MSFVVAVILTAVLALQPDFGQAGLVIATWALMYFAAGAPVTLLGGVGAGVIGVGWFAYHNSEHVARRIDGFLASEVDPRTQIGYATSAIQEGGFLGVGIGNGSVKWTLPDAHTDFIIAVAAEEFGLILCVVVMVLYMTVVVRSLLRLVRERDPFIRLAGTGLAVGLGLQALINIGVAVRLLPAKGMTLPLISYGGSSLIAGALGLGRAAGADPQAAAARDRRHPGRRAMRVGSRDGSRHSRPCVSTGSACLPSARVRHARASRQPQAGAARGCWASGVRARKARRFAEGRPAERAAARHRRRRHRRPHVPGAGAGRGDAGARLAGGARHRRPRRALRRRLPRRRSSGGRPRRRPSPRARRSSGSPRRSPSPPAPPGR